MSSFTQAKQELEQLNVEIDSAVKSNNEQISALQAANANLLQLKSGNEASIKAFSKFFK